MPTIQQINQTLEDGTAFKVVTQAYSELAAARLKKIRFGIERNRRFFEEISKVFRAVKVAAARRKITPPSQRSGTVSILITSNHRFYGDLENTLVKYFVVNTTKFKTDRIVIGKIALEFLQTMHYAHPFEKFVLERDLPNRDELKTLATHLTSYEQILVYYSRMESAFAQEPHVVDLLQKPPDVSPASITHSFNYIFEPEIENILQFFDTQIVSVLLEQTFLESELARTAARLIAMDQAQLKADDFIKQQRKQLLAAQRSSSSLRLLETIEAYHVQTKKNNDNY